MENFDIPYYIFEEIVQYVEETAQGRCRVMKWENIKVLINGAVVNKRLSKEQGEHLKKTFCREKN